MNRVRAWLVGMVSIAMFVAARTEAGEPGKTLVRGGPKDARSEKNNVEFRVASTSAVEGYTRVDTADQQVLYVAPAVAFGSADVISAAMDPAVGNGSLILHTQSTAAKFLGRDKTDRMAIYESGQLAAIVPVSVSGSTVVLDLTILPSDRIQRFTGIFGISGPSGPMVSVTPRESVAQAGGLVTVDVFVGGVSDLRAYQIAVHASAGESLAAVEDVQVDIHRPDYAFAGFEAVHAADRNQVRLTSAMYRGGADIAGMAYAGTFSFRVPLDATGEFQVRIRTDRATLLRNSEGKQIGYLTSSPARVSLGLSSRPAARR